MLNITPHRTLWSFLFSLFFPLKTHFILPQGMAVCRTVCPWGSAAALQTRGQGREQQGRREERILGPSKRKRWAPYHALFHLSVVSRFFMNHPVQEQSLVSPSFIFFPLSLSLSLSLSPILLWVNEQNMESEVPYLSFECPEPGTPAWTFIRSRNRI